MNSIRSTIWLLSCLFLVLSTVVASAAAAPAITLAVTDFADDSHDGIVINAPRLSGDLARFLVEGGMDRLAVVPVEQAREAMRVNGFTPRDLIYPSRAAVVAQAAGAEWIVIGRWTRLELDSVHDDSTTPPQMLRVVAYATVRIRVMEVASRRIILEETFAATSAGGGGVSLLRQAARTVLRRAAARIITLQPQAIARIP